VCYYYTSDYGYPWFVTVKLASVSQRLAADRHNWITRWQHAVNLRIEHFDRVTRFASLHAKTFRAFYPRQRYFQSFPLVFVMILLFSLSLTLYFISMTSFVRYVY